MVRRMLLAVGRLLPGALGRRFARAVDDDLELLVGALLVIGAAWAFVAIAGLVYGGFVDELDRTVMFALRSPGNLGDAVGPGWVEGAVRDVTALGSYMILTLLSIAVAAFFLIRRQFHAAVLVVASAGGGALLMNALKGAFSRPRPQIVPHLFSEATSYSFPSGHALASATIYLTLAALLSRMVEDRRLKVYFVGVAIFLTLIVGGSRVYLGVHWPSDVLAGWTVGLGWAVLCWTATFQLQRKGTVEQPDETSQETTDRVEAEEAQSS
jgi:undecaprenyl-diphosphatase